jgi:hypothetical protein
MKPINILNYDDLYCQMELAKIKKADPSIELIFVSRHFHTEYTYEYYIQNSEDELPYKIFYSLILMELSDLANEKSIITEDDLEAICSKSEKSSRNAKPDVLDFAMERM